TRPRNDQAVGPGGGGQVGGDGDLRTGAGQRPLGRAQVARAVVENHHRRCHQPHPCVRQLTPAATATPPRPRAPAPTAARPAPPRRGRRPAGAATTPRRPAGPPRRTAPAPAAWSQGALGARDRPTGPG